VQGDAASLTTLYKAAEVAFTGQAMSAVFGEGVAKVQAEDFFEWATSTRGNLVKKAYLTQYVRGDLQVWRHLGREYLSIRGVSNHVPAGATPKQTQGKTYLTGSVNGVRVPGSPAGLRRAGVLRID
jgi:hypothetical protein